MLRPRVTLWLLALAACRVVTAAPEDAVTEPRPEIDGGARGASARTVPDGGGATETLALDASDASAESERDAARSEPTVEAGPLDGGGGAGVRFPPPPPGSPVALHGPLRRVGNEIRDQHGHPYALHGMSLFWSQWSGDFYNADLVHALRTEWHSSVVRAALGIENGGYLERPAEQEARIRVVVEAAVAEGMYVVIDWHDHNALRHTPEAKDFFARMARDYGHLPNVVYELYSEPEYETWYEVKQHEVAVLAEIRAAGGMGLATVGSPHWSQDVDLAAADPIDDPNVSYVLHFYASSHGARLRSRAQVALDAGLALLVTEWGTCDASGNGSYDFAESAAWFSFLEAHHIGSMNWSMFDKLESASALRPGASRRGGWAPLDLTPSGLWVQQKLALLAQ